MSLKQLFVFEKDHLLHFFILKFLNMLAIDVFQTHAEGAAPNLEN